MTLRFYLNTFQFPQFNKGDIGEIIFKNCWRYRLGGTNDEGWYRGQCRFSKRAPDWGEFYEVGGDLMDDFLSLEWNVLSEPLHTPSKHFLFYLRDETFECDATDFVLALGQGVLNQKESEPL